MMLRIVYPTGARGAAHDRETAIRLCKILRREGVSCYLAPARLGDYFTRNTARSG